MCLSVKRHSGRKVNILMADIMFNGKKRDIKDNTNITEFITINSYKPEHVVVELNEEIIPKKDIRILY